MHHFLGFSGLTVFRSVLIRLLVVLITLGGVIAPDTSAYGDIIGDKGAPRRLHEERRRAEEWIRPPREIRLIDHEGGAWEGHTLGEHVDRRDEQTLRSRGLGKASSFRDHQLAERVVHETIQHNWPTVREWLGRKADGSTRDFQSRFAEPVGIVVHKDQPGVTDAYAVKVVLLKDSTTSYGFRILTAYPIP